MKNLLANIAFRRKQPAKKNGKLKSNITICLVCAILSVILMFTTACNDQNAVATQSGSAVFNSGDHSEKPEPSPSIPVQSAAVSVSNSNKLENPEPIEGFEIESVIVEDDEYIIAAHFPITDIKTIDEIMRMESEDAVSNFMNVLESLPTDHESTYEYNRDYESYLWGNSRNSEDGRFASFLFKSMSVLDRPVPNILLKSHIFDLEEERELTLSDFISEDALSSGQFYGFLSQESKVKLKSKPTNGPEWDDEKLNNGLKADKESFQHYYLDKSDFVFVFDVYQLGPWSLGTPRVHFSLDELEPFMKEEAMDMLREDLKQSSEEISNAAIDESKPTFSEAPAVTEPPSATKTPVRDLDDGGKYIAITFDDGPHKTNTPILLDLLKKYDAKATFFILGNRLGYSKDIVQRIADEGHEIGNHSDSHKNLTNMTQSDIYSEMDPTDDILYSITGKKTTLMRPPYGALNDGVRKYARDRNIPIILWTIDPEDWKYKDKDVVSKHIIDNAKEGDIILLHDIHATSIDAAEIVLRELSDDGFIFITVSELLQNAKAGEAYRGADQIKN